MSSRSAPIAGLRCCRVRSILEIGLIVDQVRSFRTRRHTTRCTDTVSRFVVQHEQARKLNRCGKSRLRKCWSTKPPTIAPTKAPPQAEGYRLEGRVVLCAPPGAPAVRQEDPRHQQD